MYSKIPTLSVGLSKAALRRLRAAGGCGFNVGIAYCTGNVPRRKLTWQSNPFLMDTIPPHHTVK